MAGKIGRTEAHSVPVGCSASGTESTENSHFLLIIAGATVSISLSWNGRRAPASRGVFGHFMILAVVFDCKHLEKTFRYHPSDPQKRLASHGMDPIRRDQSLDTLGRT